MQVLHLLGLLAVGLLISYSLLLILLALLGRCFKTPRFYARWLYVYTTLTICAAYGIFVTGVFWLTGRYTSVQWAVSRTFHYITAPVVGLKYEIEGEEILGSTSPAIYVCNHQFELDALIMARLQPRHCVGVTKWSLKYAPIFGQYLVLSDTLFVHDFNRGINRTELEKAVRKMVKYQRSIWIYPEGVRIHSTKPDLLEFKKGAFHMAIQAGVPIIPVVIATYSSVFHLHSSTFEAGMVKVKVLDPIPTEDMQMHDVDKLRDETRGRMLKCLRDISWKDVNVEEM